VLAGIDRKVDVMENDVFAASDVHMNQFKKDRHRLRIDRSLEKRGFASIINWIQFCLQII
jgi:hypothetical protein